MTLRVECIALAFGGLQPMYLSILPLQSCIRVLPVRAVKAVLPNGTITFGLSGESSSWSSSSQVLRSTPISPSLGILFAGGLTLTTLVT